MTYPGGKGRAFHRIISLMPPHATYVETHLGGGSILRRKRPARRSIGVEIDAAVIEQWRDLALPGLELVHGCAVDFLRQFSFSGNELVYVDPPYWPDSRRRTRCYRHDYTREHHLELLDTIRELPCRVMVSGYANATYDDALRGWERHIVLNQTQTGPAEEVLWTNFQPDHRLHDYTYVGHDFRDRERIKRSRQTQIERLRRAPPIERAAMLSDIVDTFTDDVLAIAERIR
jgi:DNA adenine methylase